MRMRNKTDRQNGMDMRIKCGTDNWDKGRNGNGAKMQKVYTSLIGIITYVISISFRPIFYPHIALSHFIPRTVPSIHLKCLNNNKTKN